MGPFLSLFLSHLLLLLGNLLDGYLEIWDGSAGTRAAGRSLQAPLGNLGRRGRNQEHGNGYSRESRWRGRLRGPWGAHGATAGLRAAGTRAWTGPGAPGGVRTCRSAPAGPAPTLRARPLPPRARRRSRTSRRPAQVQRAHTGLRGRRGAGVGPGAAAGAGGAPAARPATGPDLRRAAPHAADPAAARAEERGRDVGGRPPRGAAEAGRHSPLECQPAGPVRDQPAHRGHRQKPPPLMRKKHVFWETMEVEVGRIHQQLEDVLT
ncbi:uncharacterized protein [Manis javanica]|uniref:uncharacterized protein n=1 Tax=Manis javanica TaxID=9974 RepID=UPI003C6CD66D